MTTVTTRLEVGDLGTLVPDWIRAMRAENKSPNTIEAYSAAASQFIEFLRAKGMPTEATRITREHERLIAHIDEPVPPARTPSLHDGDRLGFILRHHIGETWSEDR